MRDDASEPMDSKRPLPAGLRRRPGGGKDRWLHLPEPLPTLTLTKQDSNHKSARALSGSRAGAGHSAGFECVLKGLGKGWGEGAFAERLWEEVRVEERLGPPPAVRWSSGLTV